MNSSHRCVAACQATVMTSTHKARVLTTVSVAPSNQAATRLRGLLVDLCEAWLLCFAVDLTQ